MDDEEEEALFERMRRGLERARRDAAAGRSEVGATPAPDPEALAALARVEASLRTLASNTETLARRADALDAAIETRIESTVARITAGLRADLERLSGRVAALSARPEPPRPGPPRPEPTRPEPRTAPRSGSAPPTRLRQSGRRAAVAAMVLAVFAAGAVAAWAEFGFDAAPFQHRIGTRWTALRSSVFPDPLPPDETVAAALPAPEPAPSQLKQPDPAPPKPAAAPAPTPAPLVEAAPPPPPLAATPAVIPSASIPAAEPAERPHPPSLELRANERSWVEVRQRSGHVLLRRTLQPGESWPIPTDPDLLLSTGNATGLRLVVDGQPRPLLANGKTGVLRDVPLDGAY